MGRMLRPKRGPPDKGNRPTGHKVTVFQGPRSPGHLFAGVKAPPIYESGAEYYQNADPSLPPVIAYPQ